MENIIYLVWYCDEWLSTHDRTLAYVGNNYEDCCQKIAKELEMNENDYNELCEQGQVRRKHDGIFIEEQKLNEFYDLFK